MPGPPSGRKAGATYHQAAGRPQAADRSSRRGEARRSRDARRSRPAARLAQLRRCWCGGLHASRPGRGSRRVPGQTKVGGTKMSEPRLLDTTGRRRSPAATPGHRTGCSPANKGMRYPADPPRIEEIIAVMRQAGSGVHADRRQRARRQDTPESPSRSHVIRAAGHLHSNRVRTYVRTRSTPA
jgi:hypothetical protein